MRSFISISAINLMFLFIMASMVAVFLNPSIFDFAALPSYMSLQSFKTMFLGIILEAVPFIMLGVLISSFMHIYVSEAAIQRFVPKHPAAGILFACILGILFPICECGIIPVIRRLLAKGMPLYIGVVFILVGPIVNPVVYLATYTAFRTRPDLLYARMGLALLVGVAAGLLVYALYRKSQLRDDGHPHDQHRHHDNGHDHHHHDHHHHDHHHHDHHHHHPTTTGAGRKLASMLEHAGTEFFDMGKYLMFGAILTAAIQSLIPRSDLINIGHSAFGSHLFMMAFAYILSLCSTSDAFVASSFVGTFSGASLLAFLVFGPMIDFKSTLMLLSVFKARFVLVVTLLVFALVLAGSIAAGSFYLAS